MFKMKKILAVSLMICGLGLGLSACEAVDRDVDYGYEQSAPYNNDQDHTAGERIFDNAQRK
jgi:hypothetical protein